MGKEYVITCDSCGKIFKPVDGYYKASVSGYRVKNGFTSKTFYFCPECAENGCIGYAIKNMKMRGEQA